ncbi:ABC transporter permease [Herbaspirillum sp.]|uniref:ABC transporter permease n=1 Tax=Herbaspirillum sp. TaxID=1890675 RepID=UPI0031DF1B7A
MDKLKQGLQSPSDVVTVITAKEGVQGYWKELQRFKELFFLLVWRDLLVRYKQTLIGVAWAVLRPLITVVVFSVVFGSLAKLPSSGNSPYVLMVFAGMLPWQFFATAFADAGNSVVGNANIVSKVYFPRLLIPVSSIAVCFVDAIVSAVIFSFLMIWYGMWPGPTIVFLPLFAGWLFLFVLATSVWVASLNVTYRDFRYVVPFMVQLGTYISPVGFSSSVVPEKWRLLYFANPMAAIIDGFRWSLFGGEQAIDWHLMIIPLILTFVILIPGLRFFRRTEDSFADRI